MSRSATQAGNRVHWNLFASLVIPGACPPGPALLDRPQETKLKILKGDLTGRGPHDQDNVHIPSKEMLVGPENLAHPPPHPIPDHGRTRPFRRDDAQTGPIERVTLLRTDHHLKQKDAAWNATSPFLDCLEITIPPQMLARTKTQICPIFGHKPDQTTVNRLRPLRRRLAMTWRPPRVDMRARNPILRARFLLWGRKVGCMAKWKRGRKCRANLTLVN